MSATQFSTNGGATYVEVPISGELTQFNVREASGFNVSSLTNVIIGTEVTSIGNYAFEYTQLSTVSIPSSVTSIGIGAFAFCTSLESIYIPESVTSIGLNAFFNCRSLTEFRTPDTLTTIPNSMLFGCINLEYVYIGNSVTTIGVSVFVGCYSLKTIQIGGLNTHFSTTSDGKCLTDYNQTVLYQYTIGDLNKFYSIPNTIETISDNAFNSSVLESIVVPESVTTIGNIAFSECMNLSEMTFGGPMTTLSVGEFIFASIETNSSRTFTFNNTDNENQINPNLLEQIRTIVTNPNVSPVGTEGAQIFIESSDPTIISNGSQLQYFLTTNAQYGSIIADITITDDLSNTGNNVKTLSNNANELIYIIKE